MAKITIDKEIENLKDKLDARDDTHPDYLPPELKDLQARALAMHAYLEASLEIIILSRIAKDIDEEDFRRAQTIHIPITIIPRHLFLNPTVYKLMNRLSFWEKLQIVKEFDNKISISSLEKVNSYRNEFAHPKGMNLRNKYDYNKKNGKINIRNLLRCLVRANREMDAYILKSFPNIISKEIKE